ncbi:hypothetical protein ACS0TY_012283 [Phlomoides rotata]
MFRERILEREGEWVRVGVERRKPFPERTPVRQKREPSRWTSRYPESGYRSRATAKIVEICEKDTFSCFFRNFPEGSSLDTLRKTFSRVEKVIDIFCPKKRDNRGLSFGFVRFMDRATIEKEKLMADLNNLWIGSYKIRVSSPRFKREQARKATTQYNRFEANKNLRNPEVSYRDVIARKSREGSTRDMQAKKGGEDYPRELTMKTKEEEVKTKAFKFEATKEEKQWLEGCFIGLIKEDFSWEYYGEEIRSESGKNLILRYMGDNVVIINHSEKKDTKETIYELDEWISHWFVWCRPWMEKDVCHRRKVWTRWYGIPAQAWTPRFFKLVSANVGSFVKLDAISESKKRLDVARVLISVPFLNDVNQTFDVDIEGRIFRIRIVEEFDWSQDAIEVEKQGYQSGDEDDSYWSDESTDSFMQSLAYATEHGFSERTSGGDEAQSFPATGGEADSCAVKIDGCSKRGVADTMNVLTTIPDEEKSSTCTGSGKSSPRKGGDAASENFAHVSGNINYGSGNIDNENGPHHSLNENFRIQGCASVSGYSQDLNKSNLESIEVGLIDDLGLHLNNKTIPLENPTTIDPYHHDNLGSESTGTQNNTNNISATSMEQHTGVDGPNQTQMVKEPVEGIGVCSNRRKSTSRTIRSCNRKMDGAKWSNFVEDLRSEEDGEITEKIKNKQKLGKGKQKKRNDWINSEASDTWALGKKLGLKSGVSDKKMVEAMLTYNIRGLGSRAKRREIRESIARYDIDFCCIQESKMEIVDDFACRAIWGRGNYNWSFKPSVGRSGGIISIWNSDKFICSSSWFMEGAVVVNGYWTSDDSHCMIINVYAPCLLSEREELWDRILSVINQSQSDRQLRGVEETQSQTEGTGKVLTTLLVHRDYWIYHFMVGLSHGIDQMVPARVGWIEFSSVALG